MKLIELQNIYKSYQENKYVVKDVNFYVEKGDFVVIIGPSGCGKTSLLNMISGLESITKGSLFINEKYSNNIEPSMRNMSMVFQNYALYPYMSVYDNLAFSSKNKKIKEDIIKENIKNISKMLKIDELLNRKPKQLSGGEKQRVAIGRAIMRNPIVFLMDEPLSNLDASLRNEMKEEIKKLHKKLNATIIYVTHDQLEALSLATKIIVMNKGVVEQIGKPIEIFNEPKNEFVAKFLGVPTINIFEDVSFKLKDNSIKIDFCGYEIDFNNKECIGLKKLDIGIRSENFLVVKEGENGLKVNVNYYELIGDYYLVNGVISNHNKKYEIRMKIFDNSYDVDKKILFIRPIKQKIILFNGETKENLYEKK